MTRPCVLGGGCPRHTSATFPRHCPPDHRPHGSGPGHGTTVFPHLRRVARNTGLRRYPVLLVCWCSPSASSTAFFPRRPSAGVIVSRSFTRWARWWRCTRSPASACIGWASCGALLRALLRGVVCGHGPPHGLPPQRLRDVGAAERQGKRRRGALRLLLPHEGRARGCARNGAEQFRLWHAGADRLLGDPCADRSGGMITFEAPSTRPAGSRPFSSSRGSDRTSLAERVAGGSLLTESRLIPGWRHRSTQGGSA